MVTALIPDILEIFSCDTFSAFVVAARCIAAAAMAIGFLLVDTCFFAHKSSILKLNLCVFSDKANSFAILVTNSDGVYDSGAVSYTHLTLPTICSV